MFPYIPNSKLDEKKMLDSLGMNSLEELFKDIPEDLRLKGKLNLNSSMS